MKRFWDRVDVVPDEAGWLVLLDGKPVRVPGGAKLAVPGRALADALADEWRQAGGARGGDMSYEDLPLTRLVGTAQERIAPDPEPVVLEIAQYGETDLLCYQVAEPVKLAERQRQQWQPWLAWAAEHLGAKLQVTTGIVHRPQDPAALAALAAAVATQTPLKLAALGVAVPSLGSLVLGLALAEGAIDAATAHQLANLDELFQAELWGHVDDADERRAHVAAEIQTAGRLIALSRQPEAE
jgi:chaperone required for assembly of F1-ATPase